MVENAGTPKAKAILATITTGGSRNSTSHNVLYKDVKQELESGREIIQIHGTKLWALLPIILATGTILLNVPH